MSDFLWKAATILLLPLWAFVGHGTIEKDDLLGFQVTKGPSVIELTGSSASSSIAISRVTTTKCHRDLIVTVHTVLCGIPHPLTPERTWLGALNHYKIALTPDIDRVLLGRKRVLIWSKAEATQLTPKNEP